MTAHARSDDWVAAGDFEVQVWPARETVWVEPCGELDLATAPVLRAQVDELIAAGFKHLVVDLRRLSFIDLVGLRALLALEGGARRDGWQLSVIQGDRAVRRIFEITDTLDQLPFVLPTAAHITKQ